MSNKSSVVDICSQRLFESKYTKMAIVGRAVRRTDGLVLVIVVVLGTRFYGPTGIPRRKLFRFYYSLPTY